MHENALPGVAAGARRARQRKEIGAAGDPGRRPALDRRGADLLIAEPAEQLAEAGNLRLIDAVKASGVTSRPVTPMPPVEITTPISGSLIHARSCEAGWEGRTRQASRLRSG